MDAFELINLSLCYICGVEVEKDFSQAFRLIRRIKKALILQINGGVIAIIVESQKCV